MKIHRFIIPNNLKTDNFEIHDKEIIWQIKNVLRLKVGEKIIVGNGQRQEVLAEIIEIEKSSVVLKVQSLNENDNEPKNSVTLYCSVLKKENFELVVQKTTEIGIKRIVPIISERTIKLGLNQERLEKITKEAAEQSGRGVIPVILGPMSFEEAVANASRVGSNFLFDLSGDVIKKTTLSGEIAIFIGPEGGWTENELSLARGNGINIVSLGKLTLRAETAAIIASYILTK
jgi:16S rRNA (uracil1498-N3)-methyltransferase